MSLSAALDGAIAGLSLASAQISRRVSQYRQPKQCECEPQDRKCRYSQRLADSCLGLARDPMTRS